MKNNKKKQLNQIKNKSNKKDNEKQIKKIVDVNNAFKLQLEELKNKYDLTDIEKLNLENMIIHYDNMNILFMKFKK